MSATREAAGRRGSVTVVVPAHDVEGYVEPCLRSLLASSLGPDLRVLVVDDGSTDGTAARAEAVAARDDRVRVLRRPHGGPGPGAARNHGLDLVGTEFVLFCDGDDELTPAALELLRDGLQEHHLDLAVGATEQFPEPRRWLWSGYLVPGRRGPVAITDVPQLVHNAAVGNKLFRTSWLRRRGWRFAEGVHHQDTVVTVPALLAADRFVLVGDVVHRYRKRAEGGSIMDAHYTRLQNYWDHLQVVETLATGLAGLPADRRPLLEAFLVRSFQGFVRRAPERLDPERLPEFAARTRAVVSQVSADALVAGTRHAGERAGYVALLQDDLASYRALGTHLDRLTARGGHLHLDLPVTDERYRPLLRTGGTRALADRLAADGEALTLRLRLRVHGARDLAGGLNGVVLRLLPVDGGPALARELRLVAGDPCTAAVRLPLADLLPGRYALRVAFRTPAGEAARWVRRPPVEAGGTLRLAAEVVEDPAGGRLVLDEADERAVLERS